MVINTNHNVLSMNPPPPYQPQLVSTSIVLM